MDENVKKNYEYWCTSPIFDDATKSELKSLEGNEDEIFDRFYRELEFGTGGLRGVIGAGTNRMNFYTVGKATQGLANFINKQGAAAKGVAIAFDSRRMSPEFADTAACVLAANGIKAYIFDSLRPTPELSFALRTLGCTAGIVVTASHNPPEYNGYKVYWEDGAQITAPKDAQIIGEVNAIKDYAEIKKMTTEEAKAAGLYEVIGKEIDDKYMEALKKLVLHPEAIKQMASSLKIVYTPLHGTGNVPVRRVLKELGFEQVTVVPEQELPDGNFPTVSYPNPEDKKAFALALDLAKKVDAEEYFPKETVEKMGKLGMMGIYFPTSVGGAGGDVLSYVMAVEELSKVCGTTGVIVSAHTSLCAAPIYENGTPEQKAKYLPKLCSGEWLGAFGLTEPGAGTDAQGQQTIAKEEDDCWVLNGSKIFITNAGFADVFIVIAVTDHVLDKKGRPTKLCSAFIVERTDPGFSVGKAEDKMGIRGSSTCELIFEDCRIPKDRMLGVRGKGFQLAMATLDGGRIGIASQALGIAEGALDETVAYVKERKQFGRPIAAFQNTQFELAEMKARVEAAKYLVYAAALKKQQAMDGAKVRYSVEAAQAKLIAARTASDVTRRCLQLFGGYGYTRDYPIERMMRDAKITEIYEGTSEVQMMVISGALLK